MRLFPLLMVLGGCSADNAVSDYEYAGAYDDGASTSTSGAPSDPDDTNEPPPEQEDDFLKLAPAATDAYVFVANPSRDTVSRISVPSLEVITVEVGDNPTSVETTADYVRAVTLNEGDDTITIVEAESLDTTEIEVRPGFNRMSLSGDGTWVVAWFDADKESEGDPGGIQSFNEVSLVNVGTRTHIPMAVGFSPNSVRWSEDGRLLVVVSDGSLAVVDLTAASPEPRLIDLADDPMDAPEAEEVELSPGGEYAFVRQFGANDIVVVDLAGLTLDRVGVGDEPTDLDLTPDGSHVAVVARSGRQIWRIDATNPYGTPDVIELPADSVYGSILFAGDGDQAVLYTTASRVAKFGVWNVAAGTVTERGLEKPVQSVGVSPTGNSLLVFHTLADADDADPDSPFYGEWALTQIDLTDFRPNPLLLPAEPTGYSMSSDGRYGFFIMEGQPYLETLVFESLLYEEKKLPSNPVHVGVLPDTVVAFASQEHDLGRISFYDADADTLDTITGFELNSQIETE